MRNQQTRVLFAFSLFAFKVDCLFFFLFFARLIVPLFARLIFWWYKVGLPTEPVGDLPPKLYYPGMLAISMYLGALLQCTMLGSTILGVEGKRLWIMKSNPVESVLIMVFWCAPMI